MEKRKIKDLLDNIPARIDEAQRSIPESEDWDSIKESITSNSKEIEAIDKEISDISAAIETENREYRSKQEVINRKRSELQAIEFDYKKKLSSAANEISFKITDKEGKLHNLRAEDLKHAGTLERLQQELEGHRTARQNLLNQWSEINAVVEPVLSENDLVCYACKQPLDSSDIQSKQNELTANYNTKKANDLATNRKHGLQTKALIEAAEKAISNTNVQREFIAIAVKNLTTEIETLKADLTKSETLENAWKQASEADVNYIRIKREISVLEEAIGTEPKRVNISEQTERKSAIQKELSSLIQRLNSKEFVDRAARRIDELNREQKELAQKLADLEKIEYAITGFTKAKISVIEEKINSMFSLVKVKMFNSQVNGGETETCELTVDGVPWSDLNNAMKINSGLDVINTLSKYYDIACPIFADNAEAVNDLLPMNAQTIKLYVTTDPILTIN
jgi:phage host-nuclease inhibitor protein Gam